MRKLTILCLGSFLLVQTLHADPIVFEDFSSGALNESKYSDDGESIVLDNGVVVLTSQGRAYSTEYPRNRLRRATNTGSLTWQATLKLSEYSIGNSETQQAFVGLSGMYYNSTHVAPTNDEGEVFARLAFGDRGNGLEVWYKIFEGDAEGNYPEVSNGTLDVPGLALDTFYTAKITYDGGNSFVFEFNSVVSASVPGPARQGTALYEQRRVDTGLNFGQVNSTNDQNDTTVDNGSIAYVIARIDDATDDSGLVDDFSGTSIDPNLWRESEFTRLVENGKLKLVAKNTDNSISRTSARLFTGHDSDYVGAKVTLLSTSSQNTGDNRARIQGYWYNDTYDTSNNGNGFEGEIWTRNEVRQKSNGDVVCVTSAERSNDATHSTYTDLLAYEEVPCQLNTEYDLSIELSGTQLLISRNGAVVRTLNIQTPIYPAKNSYQEVVARVQNGSGETHALFDDITINYTPPALGVNANNAQNEQVVLPTQTNVVEGEQVTLTANITNSSSIANYIWEQTAGPEVTITTAPKPGQAHKIVGSNQSITFTVPSGADLQTLSFRVTVVDTAGVESAQSFDLSVDNSKASTLPALSPPATTPAPSSDGGSSGGQEPWLLMLMLAVLVLRKSIQLNRYRT